MTSAPVPPPPDPFRYARLDPDPAGAHRRLLRLVGEGRRVLEVGCSTGYMSEALGAAGCAVTGIEVDPRAAAAARGRCRRVLEGDVEQLDLEAALGDERFDVVLCADVLEHLRDPERALRALARCLAPGGEVVASIPNVAHASVAAELLEGRFAYRPTGLLDEGHVRLFTRDSVQELFERAGLVVTHLERVQVAPERTEFGTDLARFPPEVAARLLAHEESTTYQFVLAAVPKAGGDAGPALAAAAGARLLGPDAPPGLRPAGAPDEAYWQQRVRGLVDALLARLAHLDETRARLGREGEALRAELAYHRTREALADQELARREALAAHAAEQAHAAGARAEALQAALDGTRAELDGVRAELGAVRAELDRTRAESQGLAAGVGGVAARLQALEAGLGEVATRVADLQGHVRGLPGARVVRALRRLQGQAPEAGGAGPGPGGGGP